MSRFSWLAGALGGALTLPIAKGYCHSLGVSLVAPDYSKMGCGTPLIMATYEEQAFRTGIPWAGALMGALSVALFFGRRPFALRIASTIAGVGVSSVYIWHIFTRYSNALRFGGPDALTQAHLISYTPLILWALLLVFCSAVTRPRPHTTQLLPKDFFSLVLAE